ncbi:MAG: hypothetical protein H5U37_05480, partial [Caldisericia bacterium]|nr:hypothetical protein [Caldisericia bacterium]
KKVEIEDEEFKEELKRKLFELYDKRFERRRAIFLKRAISFAIIILIVLIPSILFYKNITFQKRQMVKETNTPYRNMVSNYEEIINKFVENDEIIYEKEENNVITKKYKSGLIIIEKDGEFSKLSYNEEFLKENNIDIEYYINKSIGVFQNLKKEFLDKIISAIKTDKRFDFVNEQNIEYIENVKENLYLIKIKVEKGYLILILDLNENKIKFFSYPY